MSEGSLVRLLQSSQTSNQEYSEKMLAELKNSRDDFNVEIYNQLQVLRNEASLRHLSYFLYHYGMRVSLSGFNIEQLTLHVAFKQQQFDESSAWMLIAVCRQLALCQIWPQNALQLFISDNLTFLSLLQRAESYAQRGLRQTDMELIMYLSIKIPLPEALLTLDEAAEAVPLIQAYYISHGKVEASAQVLSSTLAALVEMPCAATATQYAYIYSAILMREIRLAGSKTAVQAPKSLTEHLQGIKAIEVPLVFKLLLLSELVYIEEDESYCKSCIYVFNFREMKPTNTNEEILLYRIATAVQFYYLLQNESINKLVYVPITGLGQCQRLYTRLLEMLKESRLDVINLSLMVGYACYFIGLAIMQPNTGVELYPDSLAEIIDYVGDNAAATLNSVANVMISILLVLLNTMLYQHSKGLSQLAKQLHAHMVYYAFYYICYHPSIHAYLQLHALLYYLDYSYKLALLQIKQITACTVFGMPTFYRQVVRVHCGESGMKLREYIILKQRYNSLVDEYNKLADSRPSQYPAVPKEHDVQQELMLRELQSQCEAQQKNIDELQSKLENAQIQQAYFQDEKKSLLQQIDGNYQVNGVLKDQLALAQDRIARQQEEVAALKIRAEQAARDAESGRDNLYRAQESAKMLRYVLQTVQSVIQGAEIK